jgi:uncharacterized membrane protein YjfL (UPF0719 family)
MSLYQRLKYSLYLAAVGGALVGLVVALASADAVGLLPIAAFDFIMSPAYLLVILVVAFVAAPLLGSRLPVSDNEAETASREIRAGNSFAARLTMLAGIGLLLALTSYLLFYALR